MTNLLPTDVETDLATTVRDLLAARCPADGVRAMYDGDRSVADPLWKALAGDLGLAGLLVPESHGGAGASAREAAVVLEELGRAVAPVPFLTSSVVATTTLLALPEPPVDLLYRLTSGDSTAAVAVPFSTGLAHASSPVTVADGRLTGTVTSVAGALEADVLLVPTDDGLWAVPAADVALSAVSSLDMSRQLADVTLDDVAGTQLGSGIGVSSALVRGREVGAALLASEQVGLARWCLTETVAYLKVRRQFGRVVGGFQAVKHRLADLYAAVEQASAAATFAAAALAEEGLLAPEPHDVPVGEDDSRLAGAVAAAYCGDLAVHAAEEALQLHGGIGMTWEAPVHLYLKRAKADQIALGSPESHRARVAALVDLPPAT